MKIIFDLDGTIVCSKKRLHSLFCDLIGDNTISFSFYWQLKFSGSSNQNILKEQFNHSAEQIEDFVNSWMSKIESDSYLAMDTLIDDSKSFLSHLTQNNELYICTARQSISQVEKQLKELGIYHFFEKIFVTEQKYSKSDLLVKCGLKLGKNDWFVGDTGHDVITGKEVGIKTCAVLSGFMSKAALEKYLPDFIITDITQLNFNLLYMDEA
jgi:phosphoglycolate phosphatase